MSSQEEADAIIPQSGPFIYDFENQSVDNIEIKTTFKGFAVEGGTGDESDSLIEIVKSSEGPVHIAVLYAYGTRYEEEFGVSVTDRTDVVNLTFIPDANFVSIAWETARGYPIRKWYIPDKDIQLITINKE